VSRTHIHIPSSNSIGIRIPYVCHELISTYQAQNRKAYGFHMCVTNSYPHTKLQFDRHTDSICVSRTHIHIPSSESIGIRIPYMCVTNSYPHTKLQFDRHTDFICVSRTHIHIPSSNSIGIRIYHLIGHVIHQYMCLVVYA